MVLSQMCGYLGKYLGEYRLTLPNVIWIEGECLQFCLSLEACTWCSRALQHSVSSRTRAGPLRRVGSSHRGSSFPLPALSVLLQVLRNANATALCGWNLESTTPLEAGCQWSIPASFVLRINAVLKSVLVCPALYRQILLPLWQLACAARSMLTAPWCSTCP